MKYNVGDIVKTNTYGDIKILSVYFDEKERTTMCDVQFLSNGYIRKGIKAKNINRGRVYNPTNGFIQNKVFQSNTSGPFVMLEHLGNVDSYAKVRIKFINTGTILDADLKNALEGRIADPALHGEISLDFDPARFDDYDLYIKSRLTSTYRNIMMRCYNTNSPNYISYGGAGVQVCDRWRSNVDNFLNDVKCLRNFDRYYKTPFLYNLDKDLKSMCLPTNRKVYSPYHCVWLSARDNIILINLKNNTQYYGVTPVKYGKKIFYQASLDFLPDNRIIGVYTREIAAASAYNFYYLEYHNYESLDRLNYAPFMYPGELIIYKAM